jgi:hypothetical protein
VDRLRLKLDLHVHTEYSRDAVNTIEEINQRCRDLSLDGYAVCDHDTLGSLDDVKKSHAE